MTLPAYLMAFLLLLLGAGTMVFSRSLVYLAIGLLGILLSVAALMALAGADFLAVAQVMVYVGGVLILLLFGILLSRGGGEKSSLTTGVRLSVPSGIVALSIAVGIGTLFGGSGGAESLPDGRPTLRPLGAVLLGNYLLIFELLSLVLLLALIGAAYLARRASAQPRNTLAPDNAHPT